MTAALTGEYLRNLTNAFNFEPSGYPSRRAANAAITAVRKFLESDQGDKISLVVFCCFLQKDMEIYTDKLP